ncbi:ALS2 C-terminal-like protein [Saguinus oedipus]|uniref:ALS2 C-terminal-like protein n=1 Tax=Saguinus oedipus TaxID=9490 RepID=A0ABQ9U3U7_SAGOE|nr:ALS2 C-terminal-like protein [Saguinus oedipus]
MEVSHLCMVRSIYPSWGLILGRAGTPKGLGRVLPAAAPFLPALSPTLHPHRRQLGVGAFPVESRWQGVYSPFRDFVCAGCPGDLQEALLGFHVQSSRKLRKSQDYLCCERAHPEDSVGSMEDILEELLQHWESKALQPYLRKALSNSLHPLGKLLQTLMLTFQATYAGVGANKHLQELAQEEVKQHAQELWAAYRGLLRVALQRKGQTLEEDEDTETRDLQVHGLVLPIMLPSFYSELFTLYLLLHEREDSFYSQGIASLSLFPDTQLLEFLDVQNAASPPQPPALLRESCVLRLTARAGSPEPPGQTAISQPFLSGGRHDLAHTSPRLPGASRLLTHPDPPNLLETIHPALWLHRLKPTVELCLPWLTQPSGWGCTEAGSGNGEGGKGLRPDPGKEGMSELGGHGLIQPTPSTMQRCSLVRDKCFLSATECLQKIMTTVDPREKLEVLERTYGEIEGTVSRVLGREYKLPMDDLLPLLIYVVSRAR